jgi:hypothetical protein
MSKFPSEILDLKNWYLTLPIGEPKKPIDIFNPQLLKYEHPKHFHVNDTCDAVCFSSFSGGSTTKNTHNPRSELRETNGTKLAWWSTLQGVHTMELSGCTTIIPKTRPSTVIGQVHRGVDDVVEVRCWIPRRSTTPVIDVFHDKITYGVLNPNYKLGDKYTIKIVAKKGKIKIYYDDMQTARLTIPASYKRCFFKAGSYIQCNPVAHNAPSDDLTESWIYSLRVEHLIDIVQV